MKVRKENQMENAVSMKWKTTDNTVMTKIWLGKVLKKQLWLDTCMLQWNETLITRVSSFSQRIVRKSKTSQKSKHMLDIISCPYWGVSSRGSKKDSINFLFCLLMKTHGWPTKGFSDPHLVILIGMSFTVSPCTGIMKVTLSNTWSLWWRGLFRQRHDSWAVFTFEL